jgi:hypothetical protein
MERCAVCEHGEGAVGCNDAGKAERGGVDEWPGVIEEVVSDNCIRQYHSYPISFQF